VSINPLYLDRGLPLKTLDNGDGTETLYIAIMAQSTNLTLTGRGVLQDNSVNTIFPSPTFTQFGGNGMGYIPTNTKAILVSSTIGDPVVLSIASALASASGSALQVMLVPGAGPITLSYISNPGDIVFLATLDGATGSVGYMTLNFQG
jgi:hypothetical protein